MTFEVAKRLVAQGNEVEWFSSSFPGASALEEIEGVRLVRGGHQWTVHWHAFRHYRGKLHGRFDAVIDQVNTVPFFTPMWAGIPCFMFMHQLAREVWWYETPFPINVIGFMAEPWYLRIYRRTPVLTVSRSTEEDLRRLAFSGPITVIPQGLEPIPPPETAKEARPTFLYIGRLAPSKRVADVIRAFALFRRDSPGQLWVAGTGSRRYLQQLATLSNRLGTADDVHFLGRVSNDHKYRIMARAHAILLASAREGWGLVITEANACGTPAVAYDVPGLRDSVRHEQTGILVQPYPRALAEGMARLCANRKEYKDLVTAARLWSQGFSYDATADAFKQALTVAIAGRSPGVVTWSR